MRSAVAAATPSRRCHPEHMAPNKQQHVTREGCICLDGARGNSTKGHRASPTPAANSRREVGFNEAWMHVGRRSTPTRPAQAAAELLHSHPCWSGRFQRFGVRQVKTLRRTTVLGSKLQVWSCCAVYSDRTEHSSTPPSGRAPADLQGDADANIRVS